VPVLVDLALVREIIRPTMSGLQFVDNLVGHVLSWPVFALATIVIFHKQLGVLILRIKSYKGLGQELTFGEELAKVEE